ncbi:NAD(P)/FAD-dependent oxidoreductase [Haloarchaeobius amylolyticus]|uniref:NAD(P)/FAD-dependent oxidoreductase n=1 Tax=Haloarchaeobius amylolyticus TaxID=1198296 RepID=UPI00226DB92B|nr:NAD(P)/FAD-dependent oxidoreductase [Haloarchaeobius amylolyticus]
MEDDDEVIVVGGGLAGLVAARHLADAGASVRLFERADSVGGRVRSTHEEGFIYDRGFQVMFTAYPAARRELDYDALDLRAFTAGACICRPGHRSILSDPFRDPGSLTESIFNRDVTVTDKVNTLRLKRELTNRPTEALFQGPDMSIREYLQSRGFSRKYLDNFAAPFYGGITLDRSLSTSKRVFEYTFKMLSAGKTAVPASGMGEITAQLAEHATAAGATVQTGQQVETVQHDGEGATVDLGGETVSADAVVVATDPAEARSLTGVEAIPTDAHSCVTQWYAIEDTGDLDAGKRLMLNAEPEGPNQLVDHTIVAPEYAPDGTRLLSGTFLGEREESDEELARIAHETLASWYPERQFGGFELRHTDRIPFAQFQQPPGFSETLPDVRDPAGPVYLAGDYTRWSSIQGAMESGTDAADAVRADLG